jgi:hypothetical protein
LQKVGVDVDEATLTRRVKSTGLLFSLAMLFFAPQTWSLESSLPHSGWKGVRKKNERERIMYMHTYMHIYNNNALEQ